MSSCYRSWTICLGVVAAAGPCRAADDGPDPNRGLYAIWAKPDALKLPFITGGQICLMWRDVQPGESRYDFSKLDAALERMHQLGKPTTVQINGNLHPDFLFEKVPHHPEALSVQVRDKQGTLQFWHPAYVKAYLDLLAAYGRHLCSCAYRDSVLGVRLNFNAIGTEHLHLRKPERDPSQWIVPDGVTPGPPWSLEITEQYKRRVVAAFIEHFTPQVRVFVRNNVVLDSPVDPQLLDHFEHGRLGLFHTSSEVEPRSASTEKRYQAFLTYGRPGKTTVYAECWADAWGRHGGKTDARWCSPPQWNYWRLLVDLNCGVSFIGVYGSDLAHAEDAEFRAAFEFADKYVGYHAAPSFAPGAWVAMREGKFLKGDYTFLMKRLEGDPTTPLSNAGPDDQRYGAWARLIPAAGRARFALDPGFARSLDGKPATVRVIYLDDRAGSFSVRAAGRTVTVNPEGTGRWQVSETPVDGSALESDASGAHVTILPDAPLALHMVEVRRGED